METEVRKYIKEIIKGYMKENHNGYFYILNGQIVEDYDIIENFIDYIDTDYDWEEEYNYETLDNQYTWEEFVKDMNYSIKLYFSEDFVRPISDNMLDLIEKFESLKEVK